MSSSRSSRTAEHTVEFLPETLRESRELEEDLRRALARVVLDLHENAHLGELMGDRPPRILEGCRKIRFDLPDWRGAPRYRLVYRNEPSDGAVATLCVLAVRRRDLMIAYAKAASRLTRRIAEEGRP